MIFLAVCSLLALVFGLLFLFGPSELSKFDKELGTIIFPTDEELQKTRTLTGTLLIFLGILISLPALMIHSKLLYILFVFSAIAIIFGVLFISFPNKLVEISKACNKVVFDLSGYSIGARRTVGILLLTACAIMVIALLIIHCRKTTGCPLF